MITGHKRESVKSTRQLDVKVGGVWRLWRSESTRRRSEPAGLGETGGGFTIDTWYHLESGWPPGELGCKRSGTAGGNPGLGSRSGRAYSPRGGGCTQ